MSTTSLAVPVSLDHLKKQAKQLHKAVQSGDQHALDRVASARPRLAGKVPFVLADAQSVVAKEQGVDSWRKLKDHLTADDGETSVLHDICLRHAEAIATRLGSLLELGVTCNLTSLNESTYTSYAGTTTNRCLYVYNLEPLGGRAALDFTVEAVNSIISGEHEGGQSLSGEERAKLTPSVRSALAALEDGWEPLFRVQVSNAEYTQDPIEDRIATDDARVLVATMALDGDLSGHVRVCYPQDIVLPALDPAVWESISEKRTAEIVSARQSINVEIPEGAVEQEGMQYVPEGVFTMGDHDQHREVYVSGFWMDTYPVTNAEYEVFVKETGREIPPHWTSGSYQRDQVDHPVANVSWDDANAYARWANKRLPTEAEWEKASRGTEGQTFPWGDVYWKDFCNGCNDYGGTTPVTQFEGASPYGVYDMSGNVFEWCLDWYEESYVSSGDKDPRGPETGQYRSIRGGYYHADQRSLKCSYRGWAPQQNKMDHLGFRCVKDVVIRQSHKERKRAMIDRISKEQQEAIGQLHESWAEMVRGSHRVRNDGDTKVSVAFVDQTTFGEVVESFHPTCHSYQFTLLPSGATCILDYALPARNTILATHGIEREVGDAPVTQEERRLFTTIVRQDLASLEATWQDVENMRVRDAEIEQDREDLDIVERGDTVILVALEYELEGTKSLINLVYPLAVFEPILDKLDALSV